MVGELKLWIIFFFIFTLFMLEPINGYKTYLVGLAAILTGMALMKIGMQAEGVQLIFLGLGFMGLKSAIKKV